MCTYFDSVTWLAGSFIILLQMAFTHTGSLRINRLLISYFKSKHARLNALKASCCFTNKGNVQTAPKVTWRELPN